MQQSNNGFTGHPFYKETLGFLALILPFAKGHMMCSREISVGSWEVTKNTDTVFLCQPFQ